MSYLAKNVKAYTLIYEIIFSLIEWLFYNTSDLIRCTIKIVKLVYLKTEDDKMTEFKSKIVPLDDSQGVLLPNSILESIGIVSPLEQAVNISVKNGAVIIKPKFSRLWENYRFLKDTQNSGELDWGSDVGNEIIH